MRLVLHFKNCKSAEMKGSSGSCRTRQSLQTPFFSLVFVFFSGQPNQLHSQACSSWAKRMKHLTAHSPCWFPIFIWSVVWLLAKKEQDRFLGWQRTVSVWVALRMQSKGFELSLVLKGLLEILTAQLRDFLCALKIRNGGSGIAFFHWLCTCLRGDLLKSKLSHLLWRSRGLGMCFSLLGIFGCVQCLRLKT